MPLQLEGRKTEEQAQGLGMKVAELQRRLGSWPQQVCCANALRHGIGISKNWEFPDSSEPSGFTDVAHSCMLKASCTSPARRWCRALCFARQHTPSPKTPFTALLLTNRQMMRVESHHNLAGEVPSLLQKKRAIL